ncbi:3-keto-disaccharide hydrolase [Spirosoma aerophilum]
MMLNKEVYKRALIYVCLLALLITCPALANSSRGGNPVMTQKEVPSKESGWRQLFNGTSLAGWKHVGKGSMIVEKGMIRGKGGMGLLYWSKEMFSHCTIRVVYRMQKKNSNSGVYIRIPVEPREEWMPVHYGYEVQIDNHPETSDEDEYHVTGTLYSLSKPLAKPGKPGPEWNTMDITLDGPRTLVVVNGVKVTDYREGDAVPARKFDFEPLRGRRPDAGYIGLQNHGENDVVYFKEVSVKPLASTK